MIDVLVADDEQPALDELAALLSADERIREVHRARSGAEALRLLSTTAVDAAFLDIHMPGLTGFDLVRALGRFQHRPVVVFVTADEAGALEAFDVRAVDYVLKPVRVQRLRLAIDRVIEAAARSAAGSAARDSAPDAAAAADSDDTVAATVGATTRLIRRRDVRWVRAEGDYSRLWTDDGGHLVRIPISELETRWRGMGFVRIHRSYLVHQGAVISVQLGAGSAPSVRLAEIELPVSRRLVAAVREQLVRGSG